MVQLHVDTWEHVLAEHPEMAAHLEATMRTIESPSHREPHVRTGRERYFRRCGPMVWIRVVAEFAGAGDRVVTAFPQSNVPRPHGPR